MIKKSFIPLIVATAFIAGFFIARMIYKPANIYLSKDKNYRSFYALLSLVQENYADEFDVFEFLTDALARKLSVIDPYAQYFTGDKYYLYRDDIEGEYDGFGFKFLDFNDTIYVSYIFKNSPAEKAHLEKLDKIIKVNDSSLIDIYLEDAIDFLHSIDTGKFIVSKFKTGKIDTIFLGKDHVEINPVEYCYLGNNTGYISISDFQANTPEYFSAAIDSLKKQDEIKNIILDLRENGGGLLKSAVGVLDNFFDKNDTLVFIKTKNGKKEVIKATEKGKLKDVNTIVLIDENTASAAELTALAFQDNDRALIIGENSYGKGVFQQDLPVEKSNFLHSTQGQYFGPSGRCINKTYDSVEFFSTKNGRIVASASGITPEIHCYFHYYSLMFYPVVETFLLNSDKQLRQLKTPDEIENFVKNYADTTKKWKEFFDLDTNFVKLCSIYLSQYLLPDDEYIKYKISTDSCVLKSKRIFDLDMLKEKMNEKDTIF